MLGSSSNPVDMLQSLHTSLSNLHDLLLHTAAKLQAFDDRVGLAKEAHLATRRQVRWTVLVKYNSCPGGWLAVSL